MHRTLKRVGKTYSVRGSTRLSKANEITILQGAGLYPDCIASIPTENAVAVASDSVVRVYLLDRSDSEPIVVFVEHKWRVYGLVNLGGDILVSVADDGKLITWHSATGNVIDKLEFNSSLWSVAKLDDKRIAIGIGINTGSLIIVAHTHGSGLSEIRRISKVHSGGIRSIAVDHKKLVTGSSDESAAVWDTSTYQRHASFKFDSLVSSVAICEEYIAVAGRSNKIDIYENRDGFKFQCTLATDEYWIKSVTFIDKDTLMISGDSSLSFISVSRHCYISRVYGFDNESWYTVRAQVMCYGRLAVIGYFRAAIISAPFQVEQQLVQYASEQYSSASSNVARTLPPLHSAWNAVNHGTLEIVDACELIKPNTCSVSIDEWTFGHHLLMRGISDGVIPKSFDYKGIQRYWLRNLYKVCASLMMGEKDIDFIIRFLNEAVTGGVLGDFAIDDFIHRVETHKDFAVGERKLVNAIWVLFMRQAETDERVQRLIRYQEIQKLTSLVTAILGCVPLAGCIVANVVDGSAVILNDFDVHGLVESLLGIGKDMTTFGTEPLVDRFLRGSAELLCEEEWKKVSVEKQKVVKDAAASLGLSVLQLRQKLCEAYRDPSTEVTETVIVEEDEDDDIATVKLDVVSGNSQPKPIAAAESSVISTSPRVDPTASGPCTVGASFASTFTPECATTRDDDIDSTRAALLAELIERKKIGLDKHNLARLDADMVAVCVAAYIVNYSEKRLEQFKQFKSTLMRAFHNSLIEGRTFASEVTDHRNVAAAVACDSISEMCDKRVVPGVEIALAQFIHDLHHESS